MTGPTHSTFTLGPNGEPRWPIGYSDSRFYVRPRQDWAVVQERYRHDQAMYSVGEYAMFVMLWHVEDFERGYVVRCLRCYGDGTARAAAVYNQPRQNRCPECFGTTFEGGIRAKVVRPAIFTDTDDVENPSPRGVTHPQNLTVESTSDFRFRNGDFVFRLDGSRWQLSAPSRVTVRTGFAHPSQAATSMGYGPAMAQLEDETSVAYDIPPNKATLTTLLASPNNYPAVEVDVINGPLIPNAETD
jgi:hypothetical protein